ncbi:MAG TPA: histidinol dehydrogenase [Actinomycetota bacterium]|nr:histidinol dehydrogenase [Actinomycetota bacterium]
MLQLIDAREQSTPAHIPRPRPVAGRGSPAEAVKAIVDDVRMRGDDAVIEHTRRLDGADLAAGGIRVDPARIEKSRSLVRPEVIDALEVMVERLRRTSERQLPKAWTENGANEFVGELIRPLRRAGVYVPGGRAAYPSSVVMGVVPAQVAGVTGIAVCSPPGPRGEIADATLAACAVTGVEEVYRIGGAQAIAALAYGTASVRPVEKIVGPGNVYVTLAKRLVRGWVGTDSDAGPTELAIVADDSIDAEVLASDLVAQAEHGPLGSHVLVTWLPEVAERVTALLELEVARHRRPDDVENALIEGGAVVLVRDVDHALETVNAHAPEHLQLSFTGALDALDDVRNAGSVFVGSYSPVAVGDYVGGTNHVLPSGGTARWASGLGAGDFVKRIYVTGLEPPALGRLAPHVEALAEVEGLSGHARSVRLRVERERGFGA